MVSGYVPLKEGAGQQTAKIINSNGEVIAQGNVEDDGAFNIKVEGLSEGDYTIAIDSPDYENDETNTFKVIDASKVPTPSINPVDDNDKNIIVNGQEGSTVTVRDDKGNTVGTVQIREGESSGTITLDQPLKAGTQLTSTASKNGKTSETSSEVTVEDKTAPDAPTIDEVNPKSTQITGQAEKGSTVRVTLPGGTTAVGKASDDGHYTIDIPDGVKLHPGDRIGVTAEDDAGNTSQEETIDVVNQKAPETPTINPVTSKDRNITGDGEAGSTITVTYPDGTTSTGTVDQDGHYSIDLPDNKTLEGNETLRVSASDDDGNSSPETTTIVEDKTAPDKPSIDEVRSDSSEITGKAEANSTVIVQFPNGQYQETTAGGDGRYLVDIPEGIKLAGGEEITVQSRDRAGNNSEDATTTVSDHTPPNAPDVNGVNSTDNSVSGKAEPGSTVTVKFPGDHSATATTDSEGNYKVDIPESVKLKGGETLEVSARDKAGNTSETTLAPVADKSAPEAPTANQVNSNDSQVHGEAEPGSTVKVTFPGGQEGSATADNNGHYSVDIPKDVKLNGGEQLNVTATDKDNNTSAPTTVTVEDKTAPNAPTVNGVNSGDKTITGQTEPGATVTVRFPSGDSSEAKADKDGKFSVDVPENVTLTGDEELEITATDKDDNTSAATHQIVADKTAPEPPSVDQVTSKSDKISGQAEAHSTVTIHFPGGQVTTATADKDGNFEAGIPAGLTLKGGEKITATATDRAGNTSDETTTKVSDKTAPDVPQVNNVTSDSTQVTGNAEPGSTVKVQFPGGKVQETTADQNGNYVVNILEDVKFKGGEKVSVTATDQDGNESDVKEVTVKDTTAPDKPTVDHITSNSTEITGQAEPNSTVTIHYPNGETAEGQADEEGNYSIQIPSRVNLKGGENISVTATDKDGNTSSSAETTVEDKTAPDTPQVEGMTSQDHKVTGTAEPGSQITVTFPDGKKVTGQADRDGNYSVDVPSDVNLKGGEEISVTSTDDNGNVSTPSKVTVVDTTAPSRPEINGVNSTDKQVSGQAEPGSTVTVTFPGGVTATGTADDDGNFTVKIPDNVTLNGGETISVTATDQAGNTSSEGSTTVADKTAPEAPTADDVTSETDKLTGTAEPGSTITVKIDGHEPITTTADDDGRYAVDLPTDLNGGEHITITATDQDGNTSGETTKTVADKTAPTQPSVNGVNSTDKQVSGQAEPGSTVTVTFPGGVTATGTADDDGNFTVKIPDNVTLNGGETISVTATDQAGNTSSEGSTTVADKTAPEAPTADDVTSETDKLTGTAEPGSTITVKIDGHEPITTIADDDGRYAVDLPTDLNGGEHITITATDHDGNTSGETTKTVADKTAPTRPSVNGVNSTDKQVSGQAEPGSTVTVTFPGGVTATGKADDDGNFTVEIPDNVTLNGGETISVTATDQAGNTSSAGSTTVADKTAPEAPTADDVTSETDKLTGTAEPGSTITVKIDGHEPITTTADNDGRYAVDLPTDLNGGEHITITATDHDGNTSGETTKTVADKTAPTQPSVNGVNSTDKQVSGQAEPGSTVTVTFPGGVTATGKADDDGNYTVKIPDNVTLNGGETISVTATDRAGNTSSGGSTTVADKTAPEAPTADDVTSESDKLTGKAEPGSTITVKIDGHEPITTTADDDGRYAVDLPTDLNGGEHITITATDHDGNTSGETTKTVADKTAPSQPSVNGVNSTDKEVSGQAEPRSTVTVTFPGGVTATGKADDDGNYTVKIPDNVTLNGGETISVTATDQAGNTSSEGSTTVADKTAPTQPSVNGVNSTDKQVSGQAEPGSTVTVTFPGGVTATGKADDDGNFTVEIPDNVTLNGGETISVTATDQAGNTSSEAEVKVEDRTSPQEPKVNNIHSGDSTISGTAEPGSTITITFPNGSTVTGKTNQDGTFIIDVPSNINLNPGDSLTVVSTDQAGNSSQPSHVVVQQGMNDGDTHNNHNNGNSTSPSNQGGKEPSINGHDQPGSNHSGATKNSENPNGTEKQHSNDSTESNKNPGAHSEGIIPSVNPIHTGDNQITGQHGTPGNMIHITLPDGTELTGKVNDDGTWKIGIPNHIKLKNGEKIYIEEIDQAGNATSSTVVTVGNSNIAQGSHQSSDVKKHNLPDTGEQATKGTLFGSIFAALGVIFLFGRRRKKEENEE
ncbi:Ig-like domain-containing protein [Staphylococcus sp. SQ8-PEA]|uniref:Ig-like domain-containing protein n=2 Tax=Staphylococcus marylandisciuri TaxID=2981529 RepID=A0ABT2QQR7_9STAP|nr:Ig-like domain-containing protein [Staphylococcus marylandisciuri]